MATLTIRNLPDEADPGRLTARERVERAQALIKPYLKPGVSLVDELLAERRTAAARGD